MSIHTSVSKIGHFITVLESIESTNNYAMGKVHTGSAKHGETWVALEQTAGKGQRGKTWNALPGENITMSVVLEPAFLPVSRQFYLSMAVALGCFDFFLTHAGDETTIKWPNDLYWRERKAGGILIENVLKNDHITHSVVGIGININQTSFPETIKNPVSLKQITGKTWDALLLAKELCEFLEARYVQLQQDMKITFNDYNVHLFKKGLPVKLRQNNMVFETTIKGVNPQGNLLTSDTTEREFNWGEVSMVLE